MRNTAKRGPVSYTHLAVHGTKVKKEERAKRLKEKNNIERDRTKNEKYQPKPETNARRYPTVREKEKSNGTHLLWSLGQLSLIHISTE